MSTPIEAYVAAVELALADLPEADRDDLLEDLPLHLADVLTESGGDLFSAIGAPADYAAELRAAAGVDVGPAPSRPWRLAALTHLRLADHRVGSLFGYARFGDLVRALAPAWWLVRAWLLVELASHATSRRDRQAWVPRFGGSVVAGLLVLALTVVASVWLGRRLRAAPIWATIVTVAAGVALVGYAVVLGRHVTESHPTTFATYAGYIGGTSTVQNVYPVDPSGRVLKDIRLFDQDGNLIQLGTGCPTTVVVQTRQGVIDSVSSVDGGGVRTVTGSVTGGGTDATAGGGASTYPIVCPSAPGPFPNGRAPAAAPTVSPGLPAPAASATPPTVPPPGPTPTR